MSYCKYCDEPLHNNPFKMGYAERVRSVLVPWRFVHKVPEYGLVENLAGSHPTVNYHRERCTK